MYTVLTNFFTMFTVCIFAENDQNDHCHCGHTIRNRLHASHLRARNPAKKPALTVLHRRARLRWCRQHRPWNLNTAESDVLR